RTEPKQRPKPTGGGVEPSAERIPGQILDWEKLAKRKVVDPLSLFCSLDFSGFLRSAPGTALDCKTPKYQRTALMAQVSRKSHPGGRFVRRGFAEQKRNLGLFRSETCFS